MIVAPDFLCNSWREIKISLPTHRTLWRSSGMYQTEVKMWHPSCCKARGPETLRAGCLQRPPPSLPVLSKPAQDGHQLRSLALVMGQCHRSSQDGAPGSSLWWGDADCTQTQPSPSSLPSAWLWLVSVYFPAWVAEGDVMCCPCAFAWQINSAWFWFFFFFPNVA